ncbi:hypothetical protein, partial [Paraburkholderia dilworthii]
TPLILKWGPRTVSVVVHLESGFSHTPRSWHSSHSSGDAARAVAVFLFGGRQFCIPYSGFFFLAYEERSMFSRVTVRRISLARDADAPVLRLRAHDVTHAYRRR